MKNIYNLSNKFRIVKDGVFEFSYSASLLQFVLGFFFVLIPLIIAFFLSFEFISLLFSDVPLISWGFNLWEFNFEFANDYRQIYGSFNVLVFFSLLYVSFALTIRNVLIYKTKNYTVLLDKYRKVIDFTFYKKSISVHFSELSHFKISKEIERSEGAKTIVYTLILVKKDFGEIELFKLQNNENRVYEIMELLNSELQLGEGEKVVFQNTKLVERFLDKFHNKLCFHKSVSWYFWSNLIVGFILLFSVTSQIILPMIFDGDDISLAVVPLVIYGLLSSVFLIVSTYLIKVSVNRLRFKYELNFTNEGVELIKIYKSHQKEVMQRVIYTDILLVRQMPIKTNLFSSNVAIAIISKQDEEVLMNSLDCFTSEFSNSIGFHLDKEDYADSVSVENFIEAKIMENAGIEVM